jgi:phasin family protein
MYLSAKQIAATGKSGMDTLIALAQAQFAAYEQVSALNFDAGKAALEGGISHAKALMSAKHAQDLVELSAAAAQPAFEKAIAYSRGLNSMAMQARAEVLNLSESRAVELNRAVISILDNMTNPAPVGLGVPAIAIKAILAASNSSDQNSTEVTTQAPDAAKAKTPSSATSAAKRTKKRKAA